MSNRKSPITAAILSALITGAGQMYNDELAKGVVLLVLQIVSWLLVGIGIGAITLPIIWAYAIYDAYKTAESLNYSL